MQEHHPCCSCLPNSQQAIPALLSENDIPRAQRSKTQECRILDGRVCACGETCFLKSTLGEQQPRGVNPWHDRRCGDAWPRVATARLRNADSAHALSSAVMSKRAKVPPGYG